MLIRDKSFYRSFFAIMIPLAGQNLLSFSVNLIDNIMLGSLDQAALAGNSLSDQVQFLVHMIVNSICAGVVIFGSQYWGEGRKDPIKTVMGVALRVMAFFGVGMFLICAIMPDRVIGLMTNDAEVIASGVQLLRIVAFSYLFFGITAVLLATLRSIESVRIGLFISATTMVVGVILNYCLIFGRMGFPRLGLVGAGLATVITRAIELIIVILYIRFKERGIFISFRDALRWDSGYAKDFFKTIWPVMLGDALWGIGGVVQSSILGHMGKDVTSANAIALTVFQITAVIAYGSASASGVMTGKAIGEGDILKVKAQTKTFQVMYLVIGVLSGLLMFFLKDWIILLYPKVSMESKALAVQFMTVLSVTIAGTAYQMSCLTGIVRAGGDTSFVLRNDLVFVWLVVVPLALLSSVVFRFPPFVTFLCLKCDQVLKCFVAVFKVNSFNWMKKLTREG